VTSGNFGWLEVSVRVVPEAAEAVAEVLSRYAPQGVVVDLGEGDAKLPQPVTVKAYLVADADVEPGMRVLDLGTGTGILALVAARLGATEVLAVDNDSNAVAVARRNARDNDVAHVIRLLHGSLPDVGGAYDLVVANILAHIIIDMAKSGLAARVRPGGMLVVSGILAEQAGDVSVVLGQQGLRVTERRQQDEWITVVARKAYGVPPSLANSRLV